jgi:hypothetical protein
MSAGLPVTTARRVNVPLAESFQMLPFPKSEMYAVRPTKASPSSCFRRGELVTSVNAPAGLTRPTWAPPTAASLNVTNQMSPLGCSATPLGKPPKLAGRRKRVTEPAPLTRWRLRFAIARPQVPAAVSGEVIDEDASRNSDYAACGARPHVVTPNARHIVHPQRRASNNHSGWVHETLRSTRPHECSRDFACRIDGYNSAIVVLGVTDQRDVDLPVMEERALGHREMRRRGGRHQGQPSCPEYEDDPMDRHFSPFRRCAGCTTQTLHEQPANNREQGSKRL